VTEHVAERILTLPISASMTEDDARQVSLALTHVLASRTRSQGRREA
jgi:dTDP-4-amino-4,6-dideoxygalactose transaminase